MATLQEVLEIGITPLEFKVFVKEAEDSGVIKRFGSLHSGQSNHQIGVLNPALQRVITAIKPALSDIS